MPERTILVATPTGQGTVAVQYLTSVFELQVLAQQRGFGLELMILERVSILPLARNILVSKFLTSNATDLLFVDADMGFRATDVAKMLNVENYDVIGGLYPNKSLNWSGIAEGARSGVPDKDLHSIGGSFSNMFRLATPSTQILSLDDPIEVTELPTGLMMISRACLSRLDEAGVSRVWTSAFKQAGGKEAQIGVYFDNSISDEGRYVGEDFTFCRRVRQAGGRVLGCPWFVTSHVGSFEYRGDLDAIAKAGLTLG